MWPPLYRLRSVSWLRKSLLTWQADDGSLVQGVAVYGIEFNSSQVGFVLATVFVGLNRPSFSPQRDVQDRRRLRTSGFRYKPWMARQVWQAKRFKSPSQSFCSSMGHSLFFCLALSTYRLAWSNALSNFGFPFPLVVLE